MHQKDDEEKEKEAGEVWSEMEWENGNGVVRLGR